MAEATYVDVGVALGRAITDQDERNQIEWWLNGIELIITARLGPVADLDSAAVRYVEAEAVAERIRRNRGGGESSISVQVDDGMVTRRWDSPMTVGDISDDWWNLLSPRREGAAFSTRPGHAPDRCHQRPIVRTPLQ